VVCCVATILSSACGVNLKRLRREGETPKIAADRTAKAKQDAYTESRLSELLTATVNESSCGGFETHGHYCEGGEENEQNCGFSGAWCNSALKEALKHNPAGLSFGVFSFDEFSRELSNKHGVRSELYDCYYTAATHPIKDNYTMPYTRHDTCLSAQEHTDESGRKFETLSKQLKGHGPLSALVKIDIEGWEWQVLEDMLVNHPAELDKIALLDLEVHFCQKMEKASDKEEDGIGLHPSKQIPILEKLLEHFAVNYFAKSMWNAYTRGFSGCPGAPGTMGNVNLVNRKMLQRM